jgi:folate-binding protein YgfZ
MIFLICDNRFYHYTYTMQFTLLETRGLIQFSGADTLPFLQGLVTNDVLHLSKKGRVYAALLTPQGKFLHDFFLIHRGDYVWIDCEKARQDDLLRRLNMYKLRSKVVIEALPDTMGVYVLWGQGGAVPSASVDCHLDPRLSALGYRAVGDLATIDAWCVQQGFVRSHVSVYDRMRIELGVPDGSRDLIVDKSTILPFGFEQLHGVDFTKGCYVGQEVTARMKHLGHNKKILCKIRALNGVLPLPETPIMVGDQTVGTLCSHVGDIGLGLVSMSGIADANHYTSAAVQLSIIPIDWMNN